MNVRISEAARERDPGVWHKDGPLAQVESMARWAERIEANPCAYAVREDAGKIAKNLHAAVAALAHRAEDGS